MKETARNANPTNGIIKNTGFPCYELYVTKSLFLTENRRDSTSTTCHSSLTLRMTCGVKDDIAWLCSYFVEHGEVNEEITTLA